MEHWLYPLTFLIGSFIGAAGIGGVALAPAIHVFLAVPLTAAIAVAMASFAASGVVGTMLYQRRGYVAWRAVPVLGGAVAVSAFLGSLTIQIVPEPVLRYGLAGLMVLVGLRELARPRHPGNGDDAFGRVSSPRLLAVGLATGWGSAVTATGGPLILLPLLFLMQVPIRAAVGLGQVVQVPIGLSASLGNQLTGALDIETAVPVAVVLAIGTAFGALVAPRIPQAVIHRIVAAALVASGVAFAI